MSATRMAALSERSSEIRSRRSRFKAEVKDGEALVSMLLIETAGGCGLCEALRIPPLKPVGRMTYRQRRTVADHIAEWEKPLVAPSGKHAEVKRHRSTGRRVRRPGGGYGVARSVA